MNITKFFQILVPKDKLFYPMFIEYADIINSASDSLHELIKNYPEESTKLIEEIKVLERKGDSLNHQITLSLGKTFITPFDREDVQKLADELDDILDFINSTGQKILLYQPSQSIRKYSDFTEIIRNASKEISNIINNLPSIGKSDLIEKSCISIHELENKTDILFDEEISLLFKNEKDAISLLKNKEILQTLEKVTDSAEDVSDTIKSIIIKYA